MGILAMIGVFFVVVGLLNLFAHDFIWGLHEIYHAIEGIKAKRTELWNAWRMVVGVISLLIGLVMIFSG